jgi:Periplasmic binding protein
MKRTCDASVLCWSPGTGSFAVVPCWNRYFRSGASNCACAQALPLLRTTGETSGLPLVYQAEVSATAPNYTAQCVAAQQKHVAAAQIGNVTPVAQKIGANCNQQGYDPIYVSEGAMFGSPFVTTAGLKNNSWFEFADQPYFADIPAYRAMDAAVDKYYPGLRSNASEWAEQSTFSWPSGILLQDAVKAGGLGPSDVPSAAEIVTGLVSLKGDTLQGTAPPLTFASGQAHKVDCWFVGRVQGGWLRSSTAARCRARVASAILVARSTPGWTIFPRQSTHQRSGRSSSPLRINSSKAARPLSSQSSILVSPGFVR